MARGRRVLTAVAAMGMVLGMAAAPAQARRGADSGGYEPTHEHGGGAAGGAYTEGGGAGGGSYTEGGGARQDSAPEGSAGKDSAKDSEGGKQASDLADVCENVFGSEPTGDLTIRTVPPDEATVRPGQVIEVTLKWDAGMLGGPKLHGWANCVTVDDVVRPELSAGEGGGANDGSLTVGVKVPGTAKPGSELCTQAIVVGQHGDDVNAQRRGMEEAVLEEAMSECLCYTVAAPAPPPAPVPAPPPPPRQPEAVPAPPPAPEVLPAVERRPEATLPVTGPSRVLLLLAGAVLLFGGLAVIGGAQPRPLPARARRPR